MLGRSDKTGAWRAGGGSSEHLFRDFGTKPTADSGRRRYVSTERHGLTIPLVFRIPPV